MGYICQKNIFLQVKHYIQRIYLTLRSTTCVKFHQTLYVIFETICHFSRHNSSVLFWLKHFILLTKISHQSANFQIFECFNQSSPNSSCQFRNHKVKVCPNFASLFSVMSPLYFLPQTFILWTKRAYRSEISRLLSGWVKIHQIS